MRILLLSAYDTLSHRYWHANLVSQFPAFEWTVLSLAPRYFNFRVRTNPASWWQTHTEVLSLDYDRVIATSLVDISVLRGLFPNLSQLPLWLYVHENQFAYPVSDHQKQPLSIKSDLDVKMVFFYACLAADSISFNSDWNRSTALAGLSELFNAFPEKWNDSLLLSHIEKKTDVLPVPLDTRYFLKRQFVQSSNVIKRNQSEALQLIWNHRWEYDKGPEYLLAFIHALENLGVAITLHIVGQQFRRQPAVFKEITDILASPDFVSVNAGYIGYIDSLDEYYGLLQRCDIVLSTALHDFQGISVLEAVGSGCTPLLPDNLVYPELFEQHYLYQWHDCPTQCANSMLSKLVSWIEEGLPKPPDLTGFFWPNLREKYAIKLAVDKS